MAISSGIIGQYETTQTLTGSSGTDRVATDKDTFLKLLVAQLSNQDPLNPVEDKEFIAQLAQFTTVEELQEINSGVQDLNAAYLSQQATNAASLINKMVVAGGDNITLINASGFTSEDDYPAFYFTLPEASAEGTLNVYETNEDGSIGRMVYSTTMPGFQAGTHTARWHGQDFNGNPLANGTYIVNITATNAEGESLLVSTSSAGVVVGVEMSSDGNHVLYLQDGRTVKYSQIELIMDYVASSSGQTTDSDSSSGSGGDGSSASNGDGSSGSDDSAGDG